MLRHAIWRKHNYITYKYEINDVLNWINKYSDLGVTF